MSRQIPAYAERMAEITGAPDGAPSDSREVLISFSSEARYLRHDWDRDEDFWEVLGHAEAEVDLTRLNSGAAPLLKDHMPVLDAKIGTVVRAWVENGRGVALVRFSETRSADDILERVRSGDVTCVSVGYAITSAERMPDEDGHPVVRVTRWVPKEISFVAIPADPTVGYGRADHGDVATITISEMEPDMAKDTNENTTPAAPAAPLAAAPAPETRDENDVTAALTAERRRVAEIDAIAKRFEMPETATRTAIEKGASVDAFRASVMDHIASDEDQEKRENATRIGMTDKEVKAFSITNVVRFLMNPNDRTRERAAFELEASRAVGDSLGREAEGVFIPSDTLMDPNFLRSQNTGNASQGGVLVAQDYRAGSFIELLRNRMALTGRGVRLLQGLQGNVDIPKQTGGGTFYWFGEDGEPTDTEAAFGLVTMTPHSAGMAIPFTRRMAQQGSPDIEALVRDDLLKGMSLGLDRTALIGHASPDAPLGIRDRIFGNAIDWANSAAMPGEDDLIDLETEVADANADVGDLAYMFSPRTVGHLKKLRDNDGRRLEVVKDGMANDYAYTRTKQIADGESIFGNWSDAIIGMWSGLDLRVDTSTKAASDGKVLRVFADIDTAVRNVESFALGKPETTTS
ncbi:MAG: phage major capsid protein [Pseudomonadota bacterium]